MTLPPLHSYQQRMVDFTLDRLYVKGELGAGLLADPGLGKTRVVLTALDMLFSFDAVHRVLLVGPNRVLDMVWPAEIQKWGLDLTVARVGSKRHRNAQIELASRDSLHNLIPQAGRWDMIVVDESQGFKSWSTKRMRSLRKMLPMTQRRLIMTGTPTPNTLADLFSQAYILDNGAALGKNVTVFRSRYMMQAGWQGRQWLLKNDVGNSLLEAVSPLVIRMDAESNLDMPDLFVNDVWVKLPAGALKIHKDMKRKLAAELNTDTILATNAASAYSKLRQIANGAIYNEARQVEVIHPAKLDALEDILDELNGKPMIVFYQFKFDKAILQNALGDVSLIDGDLNEKETRRNIERWLTGKTQVLLIQAQAGAEGLNLQTSGCADVLFYGLPDIPNLYEQGFRRIYRQGGARSVRVHRLLAEDTVDVVIRGRLDGKLKDQADFLAALKEFANG